MVFHLCQNGTFSKALFITETTYHSHLQSTLYVSFIDASSGRLSTVDDLAGSLVGSVSSSVALSCFIVMSSFIDSVASTTILRERNIYMGTLTLGKI